MPDDGENKKQGKPRQKLLIKPEDLGLTAKIKQAILDQQFGITTRLRRAMEGARDPKSFFYLKKSHVIFIILLAIVAYLIFFMEREMQVVVLNDDETIFLDGRVKISLLGNEVKIKNTRSVQVNYRRIDKYGEKLDNTAIQVTRVKDSKEIIDKNRLFPGIYRLKVDQKNYKTFETTFSAGTEQNVLIQLEPIGEKIEAEEICEVTFLIDDKFQPGAQIFPDDVKEVGAGKWKSIRDGKVPAGQYVVEISKAGYISKKEVIKVAESGEIFKFALSPTPRQIRFEIDKFPDLALTEKEINLRSRLTNQPVDKRFIEPGNYELEINKEGFEPYRDNLAILPGTEPYPVKLPLVAIPRMVVIHPSYDLPPASIQPDRVTLKDVITDRTYDVKKDTKIPPSKYTLQVEKKGYRPFYENVSIMPGIDPFEAKVTFRTDSQDLHLRITSDFSVNPYVTLDELKARFEVKKRGYFPGDTGVRPLNPTAKSQEVPIELTTIPRKVVAVITSDVEKGQITPDVITLTSMGTGVKDALTIDGQRKFKPDKYLLNIQKAGYNNVREDIIIYPEEDDFPIEKKLTALDRKLSYEIDSDFRPNVWINPDSISLNGKASEPDAFVHPGSYALTMKKGGYQSIDISIEVTPGVEPYKVKARFMAKPRRLLYDVKDEDGRKLDGFDAAFGETTYRSGDLIKPGIYSVTVKKPGYDPWAKDITIEPAEEDYTFTATLVTKARLIDLKVTASFPPGEILNPDKCFLNQRNITKDSTFKPGEYSLLIAKDGYQAIKETVKIDPGEDPYLIHRIMNPDLREVALSLSVDVEPEDNTIPYEVNITPVGGGGSIKIENGSKVMPADYHLSIRRNGYKEYRSQATILPAITPYLIQATLEALPRRVEVIVMADFPKIRITPDMVTLGEISLLSPMDVKPAQYTLTIAKAGYQSLKEMTLIPAGIGTYKITKELLCVDRLVGYEIKDKETGEILKPDSVTLDGITVDGTTRFHPKDGYNLKISVPGYNPIEEKMMLPPGDDIYIIKKEMSSAFRQVTYFIDSEFEPGKEVVPDVISLSGETIDKKKTFRPGTYDLVVSLSGHHSIAEKLPIISGKQPYEIRRTLKTKERKLILDIKGDFPPDVKVVPDKIKFGPLEVTEGSMIKPGRYDVIIQKIGYEEKTAKATVEPSEKDYIFSDRLTSRPREVQFEITGDFDPGVSLKPDEILIGKDKVKDRVFLRPNRYSITINLEGYSTEKFEEDIFAGDSAYVVKRQLLSVPRPVEVRVTSDYIKGTPIDPDVLTLDGRELAGTTFKPKKAYKLIIIKPGYKNIDEAIDIYPGVGPLKLERELTSLPRVVQLKITHDVAPTPDLKPYTVVIEEKISRKKTPLNGGDMLAVGEYILRIEMEAYDPIEETMRVFADPKPLIIEKVLISKAVLIHIKVSHDVPPPPAHPPYKVTLIDVDGTPRAVAHGNRIKPGVYALEITQPGYMLSEKKKLDIKPSEKTFVIDEKLIAVKRRLSFDMLIGTVYVQAYQILVDGRRVSSTDTFEPGKSYDLTAKFLKYQTVNKKTTIVPGEGPYIEKIDITELRPYEIKITGVARKELDGISYPLMILVDGNEVEEHHIKTELFGLTSFITFYAPSDISTIKVLWAYYYDEKNVVDVNKFKKLDQIDADRLTDHLKGLSPNIAFERLEKLVKEDIDALKGLNRESLDKVIRCVEQDLIPGSSLDNTRREQVLTQLRRIK